MSPSPTALPAANRLFTPAGITTGTLLGSLVAGVAMVWYNYRVLGYPALGNRIAAAGLIFYLMIITAASMAPNTVTIGISVMLGQCVVAWGAASTLQGPAIDYHRARGGAVHGPAMAALVGLVIGVVAITMLLLIGRAFGLPIGVR